MTNIPSLSRILVLNNAVEVVELDETNIQIYGVKEAFTIADKNQNIRLVLSWFDGTRSEEDVRVLLRGKLADSDRLIDFLKAREILIEAGGSDDSFVDYLRSVARPVAYLRDDRRDSGNLTESSIRLRGSGALAVACQEILPVLGLQLDNVAGDDSAASLILGLSDTMDHSLLRRFNQDAVKSGRPILFASLDRFLVRVGPLVVPGESACFECFHHRLRSQLHFPREFDARVDGKRSGPRNTPSMLAVRIASTLVATSIAGFFLQNAALGLPNVVLEQNLLENKLSKLPILKLPRCPICGPAGSEKPQTDIYAPIVM
jgi:bacteriocin biosynthesis cyclodehydratase domain-containing protein